MHGPGSEAVRDRMRTALAAVTLGFGLILAAAPAAAANAPSTKATTAKASAGKAAAPRKTSAAKKSASAKKAPAKTAAARAPEPAPEAVTGVAHWALATGDNVGLPFMVIDKVAAKVFVFEADGALRGSSSALLGLARGDDSVPGIGDRRLSSIKPGERTTPAGRFVAAYGPAAGKTRVLWVDYGTAISIHPVPGANPKEQRLRRLSSRTAKDNRITYGCINVSAGFYENVVRRTFTGTKGVVYILPEDKPIETVFPGIHLQMQARAPTGEAANGADVASSPEGLAVRTAGGGAVAAAQ